jgi:hypothetical protein
VEVSTSDASAPTILETSSATIILMDEDITMKFVVVVVKFRRCQDVKV